MLLGAYANTVQCALEANPRNGPLQTLQIASLAVSVAQALCPQTTFVGISKGWGLTRVKGMDVFSERKLSGCKRLLKGNLSGEEDTDSKYPGETEASSATGKKKGEAI